MPSQGATAGIAMVAVVALAVFCLVYYLAWFRPHEEKRKQREERRRGKQPEENRNGEDVVELETVVIHRYRDRDRDRELERPQDDEARHQSRGQQTSPSPTRVANETRPNGPEYNPLRMHASMHSTQCALPGPPVLPPIFYVAQPPAPFFGPAMPPPPPPPPNPLASGSPKGPRRRHRNHRPRKSSRRGRVRHPSPGHVTTISDGGSDRGGSLPPGDRRGRSVSRSSVRSRSASPVRSIEASPTQGSMVGRTSVASSSLDPESESRLDDLVQHGGDPVSPVEQNQDNDRATTLRSSAAEDSNHGASHHRQSALEALESDTGLGSLSTEDGLSDPAVRQHESRIGRANRRYEINQDRDANIVMFMRPADGEPRIHESQAVTSTESGSGSANEANNLEPVSPINIIRFPTDILGLGRGESRVGRHPHHYRHDQQRQEPRLGRPTSQGLPQESRLGRPGPQFQHSSREPRFDGPSPRRPIPESRIGGRRRSPSRESRERPATRRESRGFPGMTGESRIGQSRSSSGQSLRQGDYEPRTGGGGSGGYRRGRVQDSPTFSDLVPLQHPRPGSRSSINSDRRSPSILNNSFFNNNNIPELIQNQGRSVVSQTSSTGAVCSYDSGVDNTQRRRRATSLGGGSIFSMNTNANANNSNNNGYGSRRGNRSVSGPGAFPSGGGARD